MKIAGPAFLAFDCWEWGSSAEESARQCQTLSLSNAVCEHILYQSNPIQGVFALNAFPEQSPSSFTPNQVEPVSYGGFWRRLGAFLIDHVLLELVACLMGMGLGLLMAICFSSLLASDKDSLKAITNLLAGIMGIILNWLYYALLESSEKQATFGKIICGLQVTDLNGERLSFGRATGRFFAKWISGLTCLIGYIMAAFTARKQALHDMIAGTLVIKKQG